MKTFLILVIFFSFGCGVKGDPKPPFVPASMGHGERNYSKATEKLKLKKPKKEKPTTGEEDWDSSEDFEESTQ